jgi:hypothetical protein
MPHKGPRQPFSMIFSLSTDTGGLSPDNGTCAPLLHTVVHKMWTSRWTSQARREPGSLVDGALRVELGGEVRAADEMHRRTAGAQCFDELAA